MPLWLATDQYTALGLGLFVGLVLALTGAGGAVLSVPLLVFGLHLTIAHAAPISLLAVAVSAFIGALLGLHTGILRYKAAILMAAVGLILSPIGLWLARLIPNTPLTLLFSAVLIFIAVRMLTQATRELAGDPELATTEPPCRRNQVSGRFIWTLPCARSLATAGGIAGFLSGLLGVGGGFIIVPALKKFTDLPMQSITATSLGVLSIISGGGVLAANLGGHMDWHIALPFATGSVVSMLAGRYFSNRIKGARLQQAFSILLLVIALFMTASIFK